MPSLITYVYFDSLGNLIERIVAKIFRFYKKKYDDNITIKDVDTCINENKDPSLIKLYNYIHKHYNGNMDVTIDFEEIIFTLKDINTKDNLKYLFEIFDKNSDRVLNAVELKDLIDFVRENNIEIMKVFKIIEMVSDKYIINYEQFLEIIDYI